MILPSVSRSQSSQARERLARFALIDSFAKVARNLSPDHVPLTDQEYHATPFAWVLGVFGVVRMHRNGRLSSLFSIDERIPSKTSV
jgi:hypothetical protein